MNIKAKLIRDPDETIANQSIPQFTNKAFVLQQVSTGFLYSQLKKLKINKATGLDCIPPRLLSDGAGAITGCLTHIIDLSFTTGVVAEE